MTVSVYAVRSAGCCRISCSRRWISRRGARRRCGGRADGVTRYLVIKNHHQPGHWGDRLDLPGGGRRAFCLYLGLLTFLLNYISQHCGSVLAAIPPLIQALLFNGRVMRWWWRGLYRCQRAGDRQYPRAARDGGAGWAVDAVVFCR